MTPALTVPEPHPQEPLLATPSAAAQDNPGRRSRGKESVGEATSSTTTVTTPEESPGVAIGNDITDPPLPDTLREALTPAIPVEWANHPMLQGFLAALQQKLNTLWAGDLDTNFNKISKEHFKAVDDCMQAICDNVLKRLGQVSSELNEHASYQLANALANGIALRHDPYTADIQAISPQGFPIRLHIAKPDATSLVEAIPALSGWLHENGYTSA